MEILKEDYIKYPLIGLLSILLLIAWITLINLKFDKDFDNLINSKEYKQSEYIIYEYNSDCGCTNNGYFIKSKNSEKYYSFKTYHTKFNDNTIQFCVLSKNQIIKLFNQLNIK